MICCVLFQLTLVLKPKSTNLIHCDNQSLVALYRKARSSKNLLVNRYLELIYLELYQREAVMEVVWVSTEVMAAEGADGLSRNDNEKLFDPYSLSAHGQRYVKRIYGKFDLDLYASVANCLAETRYCSTHCVQDEYYTGKTAQEALQGFIEGKLFMFPPVSATVQGLHLLSLNPSTKYSICLLIRSQFFELCRTLFSHRKNFSSQIFVSCTETKKRYLNKKISGTDLILITFGEAWEYLSKQSGEVEDAKESVNVKRRCLRE